MPNSATKLGIRICVAEDAFSAPPDPPPRPCKPANPPDQVRANAPGGALAGLSRWFTSPELGVPVASELHAPMAALREPSPDSGRTPGRGRPYPLPFGHLLTI